MGANVGGMQMSERTYPLTLRDLSELADAICLLDWLSRHADSDGARKAPDECHAIIRRALGEDAHLIYGVEDAA